MSNNNTNNVDTENTNKVLGTTENGTPEKSLDSYFQDIMANRESQFENDAEQLARMVLTKFHDDRFLTFLSITGLGNSFQIDHKDTKIGYSDITRRILIDKLASVKGLNIATFEDNPINLFITTGKTSRTQYEIDAERIICMTLETLYTNKKIIRVTIDENVQQKLFVFWESLEHDTHGREIVGIVFSNITKGILFDKLKSIKELKVGMENKAINISRVLSKQVK